jgi:Mor family transcriptional regulator
VAAADHQQDLIQFTDDLPALLERVGAENLPAERWAQTLADVIDVTEAALAKFMEGDQAKDAARIVAAAWAEHLGGQPMYLSRGDSLRTALEHAAIWHAWDGKRETKFALAKRFNTTPRTIERIIVEQAALHRKRFQGSLFSEGHDASRSNEFRKGRKAK